MSTLVAMSGGVDSSVAAALLVEAGESPIGVSMRLYDGPSRCCSIEDVDDARRVAFALGMPFYVASWVDEFRREVIEPFADAYLAGRTPIPCATCNKRFKFDYLLERARVFGCDAVATGHYARRVRDAEGRLRLARGRDRAKDQSYFLFELDAAKLARARFPVGELSKEEVRERARKLDLATAEKAESQEICFVPGGDYRAVVEGLRPGASERPGEIVDAAGRVLGRHAGVHRFTVGQRRGLGLSTPEPMYVRRLEPASARVVVAPLGGLAVEQARLDRVCWPDGEPPEGPLEARVQVRHRHDPVPAVVCPDGAQRARVRFADPVRGVAPGQAAVFYDPATADRVLGGGWIAVA